MRTDIIYRLEFSFDQQQFHLDNYSHDENTHGWLTVDNAPDSLASTFIDYIEEKYTIGTGRPISVQTVQKEWALFAFIIQKYQERLAIFDRKPITWQDFILEVKARK